MSDENKDQENYAKFFSAIANSIHDHSDEELLDEVVQQGLDPYKIANKVDSIFEAAILDHVEEILERITKKRAEVCDDVDR